MRKRVPRAPLVPSLTLLLRGCWGAGEYLKEKGADDTVVNGDGLTCYEGLGLGRDVLDEEE